MNHGQDLENAIDEVSSEPKAEAHVRDEDTSDVSISEALQGSLTDVQHKIHIRPSKICRQRKWGHSCLRPTQWGTYTHVGWRIFLNVQNILFSFRHTNQNIRAVIVYVKNLVTHK